MFRNFIVALIIFLTLVTRIFAGERGPGKYSGIVIFDQWDTCYLYSGIYLMYVAEKEKEKLRKYKGQSIEIDAKKVTQPMNPGDGLISEFDFLGLAKTTEHTPNVEGLHLSVTPKFNANGSVHFQVEIENQSDKTITVSTNDIAPTLLGEKIERNFFSPSDGKSVAKITRCDFLSESCGSESNYTVKDENGTQKTVSQKFSLIVEERKLLPRSFTFGTGQKRQLNIALNISSGKYDFLCGYGGGVHESKGIASNIVSFSVDEKGKASAISIKAKEAVENISIFNSDLMNLLFGKFSAKTLFSNFQIL